MGVNLKYDVEDLTSGVSNIEALKTDIENAKTAMENGLTKIRADWVSSGGDAFFDSIDTDWVKGVENCIDVLDEMIDSLKVALSKYGEIETEASNYLKF